MKIKHLFVALLITISSALTASASEFQDAVFELNRGNFKEGIRILTPLVEDNYSPAQYQMGLVHLNGWGVIKSKQKAFELFSLSATQNYPDALFDLSQMYTEGEVIEKDLKAAYELMHKAAKKGLAGAQFNLAVMYYNGTGTDQDDLKASRWYQRAADQNFALAQFNLALMYFEGKGVEKSLEMSYVWNTIAARNGYADAETSRAMDEHKLSISQIEVSRLKADNIYRKIVTQNELKAKKEANRPFL